MPICSSCKKEHNGKRKTCDHCLSVIKAWRNKNKEKVKAIERKYYQKNREQKLAYSKKWTEEQGPEYSAAKRKRWYDKHRETHIQNCMQWHASHRDQIRIIEKRWYDKNTVKALNGMKKWQHDNPKKISIYRKTRRARLLGNGIEKITLEQIQKLEEIQNHRDFYTDEQLQEPITWDHVIPISKGGPHSIANIVLTNHSTNAQKSTKSAKRFLSELVSSHRITNEDAIRKLEYLDNLSRSHISNRVRSM